MVLLQKLLNYDVMPIFIYKHLLIFTILITCILLQTNYSYHLIDKKKIQNMGLMYPIIFLISQAFVLKITIGFVNKGSNLPSEFNIFLYGLYSLCDKRFRYRLFFY